YQLLADADYAVREELHFINGHHICGLIHQLWDLFGLLHRDAIHRLPVVGRHLFHSVAVIQCRLEHQNLLLGDGRPFDPADQLFRLAREHGAYYHFQPGCFAYWHDLTSIIYGAKITELFSLMARGNPAACYFWKGCRSILSLASTSALISTPSSVNSSPKTVACSRRILACLS